MEVITQNKKYLVVFAALLLLSVFLLMVAFSLFFPSSTPTTSPPPQPSFPTNAPIPKVSNSEFYDPYSDDYKKSVEEIQKEEKAIHDRNLTVGRFTDTLPYSGTNFSAQYDIRTNSVIVTIPANNRTAGEAEFTTYLTTNGIENRSWIQNLSIQYE